MEKAPTLEWWDFDKIGFKYSISRNVILNDEEAFKYCLTFTMWLWTTLCLGQLGYFKPWLSCINPFHRKPVFPLNFTISLLWPPPHYTALSPSRSSRLCCFPSLSDMSCSVWALGMGLTLIQLETGSSRQNPSSCLDPPAHSKIKLCPICHNPAPTPIVAGSLDTQDGLLGVSRGVGTAGHWGRAALSTPCSRLVTAQMGWLFWEFSVLYLKA